MHSIALQTRIPETNIYTYCQILIFWAVNSVSNDSFISHITAIANLYQHNEISIHRGHSAPSSDTISSKIQSPGSLYGSWYIKFLVLLLQSLQKCLSLAARWKKMHTNCYELTRARIVGIFKPTARAAQCIGAVHLFVRLSPKCKKTCFSQKLSNFKLCCLLTTYKKSHMDFSKNLLLDP